MQGQARSKGGSGANRSGEGFCTAQHIQASLQCTWQHQSCQLQDLPAQTGRPR